jgi:hypothetical protein
MRAPEAQLGRVLRRMGSAARRLLGLSLLVSHLWRQRGRTRRHLPPTASGLANGGARRWRTLSPAHSEPGLGRDKVTGRPLGTRIAERAARREHFAPSLAPYLARRSIEATSKAQAANRLGGQPVPARLRWATAGPRLGPASAPPAPAAAAAAAGRSSSSPRQRRIRRRNTRPAHTARVHHRAERIQSL